MVCVELGSVSIAIWSMSPVWTVVGIFAGLFGAIILLVVVGVTFGTPSLEDQVEAELRKCMERGEENRS